MSSMALGMHFYGACGRTADTGGVSKEDILPYYHFTLAFENLQVLRAPPEQLVLISGRCRRVNEISHA